MNDKRGEDGPITVGNNVKIHAEMLPNYVLKKGAPSPVHVKTITPELLPPAGLNLANKFEHLKQLGSGQ